AGLAAGGDGGDERDGEGGSETAKRWEHCRVLLVQMRLRGAASRDTWEARVGFCALLLLADREDAIAHPDPDDAEDRDGKQMAEEQVVGVRHRAPQVDQHGGARARGHTQRRTERARMAGITAPAD